MAAANGITHFVATPHANDLYVYDRAIIRVRRSDDMRNPVRRRHPAHFDSYIPRLGPVINLRQNMAMNVDHEIIFTSECADLQARLEHIPNQSGSSDELRVHVSLLPCRRRASCQGDALATP